LNRIVITDCDHPTIEIERAIFARAGYRVELARCHTADEVVAAGLGAVALLAQYAPITDAVLETLPSVQVVGGEVAVIADAAVRRQRMRSCDRAIVGLWNPWHKMPNTAVIPSSGHYDAFTS
jgi:hypothetical protein